MVVRSMIPAAALMVVALSGCVQGSGSLALQDVDTPEFVTVFVQSDDEEPRKLRIDILEARDLVASKIYHTPGTGLAREVAISTEVDLEQVTVNVYLDGIKIGTSPGPGEPCRMGEAFVYVILEQETSVSARCT